MASIVGRWKGTLRQAKLGETPIREIRPGDIADLVINADGTAYMEKKKSFGRVNREYGTWYQDGRYYIIEMPDVGLQLFCAISDNGDFLARWCSSLKTIDGMGITYRRV